MKKVYAKIADVRKMYALIFVGLLIGAFTQAINTNDTWNMYKIIMYSLSSLLVIIGYLGILSFEEVNKLKKSIQLLVYISIYGNFSKIKEYRKEKPTILYSLFPTFLF